MLFSEPMSDAWERRYGFPAPADLPELRALLNHRSVRNFKAEPVSERVMEALVAAGQSASTSSNLQLWSVVSVQEPERREKIAELCAGQKQVREAAWFLAFLADTHRLAEAARARGLDPAGLDYIEFYTMAVIDAALAAERMVCAAESLGLGVCYIGALRNDPYGVQEFLRLPKGTFGTFGLCIGWPSDEERAAIKPRLRQEAIWFRESYPDQVDVSEYDERMKPSYARRGVEGDWSSHSGRRVDGEHMTGRDRLRAFLEEQGFNHR